MFIRRIEIPCLFLATVNYQPMFEMEYPFGWQALVLNSKGVSGPNQPVTITCVPALQDPDLW